MMPSQIHGPADQTPSAQLRECPDCGHFSQLPRLRPGTDARCPRCDCVLRRERSRPLDTALACTLAGLIFYFPAVFAPFLEVRLSGQFHISTLQTGPFSLADQGLTSLAVSVWLFTIGFPLAKLLIMLVTLVGLRLRNPPRWLHIPFRWLERLSPWAMVEVYLLGVFVAYTRLISLAQVRIEFACFSLVGLMLAMIAAEAALDPEVVWEELEQRQSLPGTQTGNTPSHPHHHGLIGCHVCHRVNRAVSGMGCMRCGSTLHARKPSSIGRTWSLLVASMLLYIPANMFDVMIITRLAHTTRYTILGGARELLEAGLWPLALLVFFASILVPMLKLTSMTWMLIATHTGSSYRLRDRTRLYRLVDFIGRWSMIDVFMISILVALMQFGQLARINSDIGAVAFASVVVFTMFGAEAFDPRLMWDAAARRQTLPAAHHPDAHHPDAHRPDSAAESAPA